VLRNRGSILERKRILVDTTFLLPALGIEVEEEALEVISMFRNFDVYYLEIALLEALWKILKIVNRKKFDRVKLGLEAIRNTYRVVIPPPDAFIDAIRIYDLGHRDIIDNLHYTTAKSLNIPWLTIDYRFIEFLESKGFETDGVILTPRNLKYL